MKCVHFLLITLAILASAISIASAYDPSPLQDFCIAIDDPKRALFVNGKFCKDPKFVNANDFTTSGLNIPGNTNNQVGSNVTTVFVDRFPGLNTLGVAIARIDFAPYGENPPHTHPRASEILFVAEGTLYAGFVSSNQDGNRLFAKVINKGDVFVFPIGMIHFQVNIGHTPAIAFVGFNSQFPGLIRIADAVFGSNPAINPGALAKAFQLDQKVVEQLQKKFWVDAD